MKLCIKNVYEIYWDNETIRFIPCSECVNTDITRYNMYHTLSKERSLPTKQRLNDWFTWMTGLKSYRTGCRQWLGAKELYRWDSAAIISCSKNSNIVVGHLELTKPFLSFMQKNKNKNDKPNKHIANYKFVWAVWILHWA